MANSTESKKGILDWLVIGVSGVLLLYSLFYISHFGFAVGVYINAVPHSAIVLACILTIVFLRFPAKKGAVRVTVPWYDVLAIMAGLAPTFYMAFFYESMVIPAYSLGAGTLEIILGILCSLAVIEAVRRTVGIGMVVVLILFLIYPLISNYLPGFLQGRGYSLSRWAMEIYLGKSGIFGIALHVAANIVVIFIAFGTFLSVLGAGKFFIDLALSIVGGVKGGPAKVAIVASALFGSISGSTAANVATTGTITIPMMKRLGYKPAFAGAIEAVASNGGQIMPPVMGVVAFVLADFLGVSYLSVCIAALVPALLYFASVFLMIDFEARKTNLAGVDRSQIPSLKKTLGAGWPFILPLLVLIFLLVVLRYSPEKSAFLALVSLLLIGLLKKESRLTLKRLINAAESFGPGMCTVGSACAGVGIVIGAVTVTGMAHRFSGLLVDIAGGHLIILLLLSALASFILGMGSGTVTCYIALAVLVAPAIEKYGVLPMAAHLFILYWGLAAYITPPVAIAAYVAASIADSEPIKTGLHAVKLGIVSLLIPFLFVYSPALLLMGSVSEIAWVLTFTTIAILALSSGLTGYLLTPISLIEKILLIGVAFALPINSLIVKVLGIGVFIITILWQILKRKQAA